MTPFRALLSGPDGGPAGTAVSAHFFGTQLTIDAPGHNVDVAQLVVSVGGVNGPELFLNWLDEQGRQASLKPLTADDIAIVLREAPAALQPQLQRLWSERQRNRRQVSGWLAGLTGAAVVATALLWWQGSNAIGVLAGWIPLSTEKQLGELALAQVRAQGGIVESGVAQQTVQDIGRTLTAGSRYPYRWLVKQDDTVNAFAMPGGIIVVHTGLLRQAGDPGELAGVLAHEVQHVEQRHSLRQMISSLGWGALVGLTIGDISAVAAMLAHQAGTLYLSRDMEEEADRLGLLALQRAQIRPDGMLRFFQRLDGKDQAKVPDWISSHPQTAARAQQIESLIDATPCPACRPLTSSHWPAMKAALPPTEK
ncbi:beta-barrel assembly-enhancing protease precursor [Janthinobacterium sp. HH106]|uniref:M48 family metallopeptidase n=1 Tax=Janthinobacterium sp. HH106 TaxID=1537278 RepID=UPI000873FF95|nr:M48 family metallopeptidase [Janthinobacterium sp. HH106]OEZ82120.1 beta-barrel assembly-enhancing protease precursor [Janthinobacterium sp. HH106]